ncbi:MAG: hypothetical protein LC130_16630 [Bryobacterales bacterium]|nr:hypothetical protein [Bryobacterales bacterium]
MRYERGLIQISERADVPILRLAYRAGHLTMQQLYESLNISATARTAWHSFRWRARRLAEHGFLERSKVDGLGVVLSLGSNGELFLQSKEPTVVSRASRTGHGSARDQVWHDVEVFGMQMMLRRAGVVRYWQFETEIRTENRLSSHRYAKDYDAIVTFDADGRSGQIALEYERTAKSERAYEEICRKLDNETRVPAFLYLAQNPQLQSLLLHWFCATRRRLYVGLMQEFCAGPLQARLIDARLGATRGLRELLEVDR